MKINVSFCLPVYNSEKYLKFCLESIAKQNFKDYEIVIVNDCSPGTDEQGNTCKKIVKSFHKEHRKIKLNYLEHEENKGLFEARRTAVYAARGTYIFVVDSDDFLATADVSDNSSTDAISQMYKTAVETGADIVQARSIAGSFPDNQIAGEQSDFIPLEKNKHGEIYIGTLENRDIFTAWFIRKEYSGMMWAKLIRREVYLEALDKIPPAFCNMSEEFLQYFFISQLSKKYVGIENLVYYYRQNSGMTAAAIIKDESKWRMICSTSTVYTIIYTWLEEEKSKTGKYPILDEEVDIIRQKIQFFVYNNLVVLKNNVVPEFQEEARNILNEYWGEGLVNKIEEKMLEEEKSDKTKLDRFS